MTREEITEKVRALVADSLAMDVEAIRPESRLTEDLGASSLDFVDLVFTVERTFGVKLRESELDFLLRLDFSSPEVMRDGALTPATVARAAQWLPALRNAAGPVSPRQLFAAVTVDALSGVVARRLEAS